MTKQFEKRISELGYSHQIRPDGFYILCKTEDVETRLKVQLICSKPADIRKYGSHNNNKVESIGLYRFKLNAKSNDTDFIIFVFPNTVKQTLEYIIIPTEELKRRLTKDEMTLNENLSYKMIFWLMPDGLIYNCSDISIEGEWFFMSKGVNGRLADHTEWDYTDYLNAWHRLTRIGNSSDPGLANK